MSFNPHSIHIQRRTHQNWGESHQLQIGMIELKLDAWLFVLSRCPNPRFQHVTISNIGRNSPVWWIAPCLRGNLPSWYVIINISRTSHCIKTIDSFNISMKTITNKYNLNLLNFKENTIIVYIYIYIYIQYIIS